MRLRFGTAAVAAALGFGTAAVPAEPAYPQHDVRCFIVMSMMTNSKDSKIASAGLIGSVFFAGKIYGSSPTVDFKSVLDTEVANIDKVDVAALGKECGQEMQARGGEIQEAGKALQAKAQTGKAG